MVRPIPGVMQNIIENDDLSVQEMISHLPKITRNRFEIKAAWVGSGHSFRVRFQLAHSIPPDMPLVVDGDEPKHPK